MSSYYFILTLTVPGRDYPRDALVRVRVTIANVSGRNVYPVGGCPFPAAGAEVRNAAHTTVYPPPVAPVIFPPCPGGRGTPLHPGQRAMLQPLIILRGAHIRAFMVFLSPTGYSIKAVGAPLGVHLATASRPAIHLHPGKYDDMYADVSPTVPTVGPLFVADSTVCGDFGGTNRLTWHQVEGRRLVPGCGGVTRWNAVAGWLNHPVATITYSVVARITRTRPDIVSRSLLGY